MILSGSLKRNAVFYVITFIICGFLNVIFEDIGFTECSRLYCGAIVLVWALSIRERVTNSRLRNLLLLIAAQILLCSLLQIFVNQFFLENSIVRHYLWYIHYAPMMAIALLCFYLSLFIYRPEDEPLTFVCFLPGIVGALLTLGVLTNDLHFWAFRIPNGVTPEFDDYRNWLIYFFMVFMFAVVIAAYCVIIKKHQRYCSKKHCCLPLIPIFIEVLYLVLYVLDLDPKLNGVHLWDHGEIFCIFTVVFLEMCIQTGMIPANKDYDKLFSSASYPLVILDNDGNLVYKTSGAHYPFEECEDVEIKRHSIYGGSIEWTVDVKYTRLLNQKLMEATRQLEARNAYLAEENRIKREKAELRTRNRLYDDISRIIHNELSEIDALLNDSEKTLEQKLPKIALLKAYIKRRSNMELLSASGPIPAEELTAAVTETLEYLRLSGVDTALTSFGTGIYPAEVIIAAYERFWEILRESFGTLSHINVSVRAEKENLTLRILLKSESFSFDNADPDISPTLCNFRAEGAKIAPLSAGLDSGLNVDPERPCDPRSFPDILTPPPVSLALVLRGRSSARSLAPRGRGRRVPHTPPTARLAQSPLSPDHPADQSLVHGLSHTADPSLVSPQARSARPVAALTHLPRTALAAPLPENFTYTTSITREGQDINIALNFIKGGERG